MARSICGSPVPAKRNYGRIPRSGRTRHSAREYSRLVPGTPNEDTPLRYEKSRLGNRSSIFHHRARVP